MCYYYYYYYRGRNVTLEGKCGVCATLLTLPRAPANTRYAYNRYIYMRARPRAVNRRNTRARESRIRQHHHRQPANKLTREYFYRCGLAGLSLSPPQKDLRARDLLTCKPKIRILFFLFFC